MSKRCSCKYLGYLHFVVDIASQSASQYSVWSQRCAGWIDHEPGWLPVSYKQHTDHTLTALYTFAYTSTIEVQKWRNRNAREREKNGKSQIFQSPTVKSCINKWDSEKKQLLISMPVIIILLKAGENVTTVSMIWYDTIQYKNCTEKLTGNMPV